MFFFITNTFGRVFSDCKDIESVFCNFYSNLWNESRWLSFFDLLHALSNDFNSISESEEDLLIREVTRAEVHIFFSPFLLVRVLILMVLMWSSIGLSGMI